MLIFFMPSDLRANITADVEFEIPPRPDEELLILGLCTNLSYFLISSMNVARGAIAL